MTNTILTDEEISKAITQAVHAVGEQGLGEEAVTKIVDSIKYYAITSALFEGWKMGIFRIAGWDEQSQEVQWVSD